MSNVTDTSMIDLTSYSILMNNQPFSPTQQELSMRRYWDFATTMLSMVLRYREGGIEKWEIPILLTEKQQRLADQLKRAMNHKDDEEILKGIDLLLKALLFEEHRDILISQAFAAPMHVFLVCSNLKAQAAGFSEPFNITPKLSAIQFVIRAIAIKKAIDDSEGTGKTVFEYANQNLFYDQADYMQGTRGIFPKILARRCSKSIPDSSDCDAHHFSCGI